MNERRVVCAAIRDLCGQVVLGPRHFDGVMHMGISRLPSYTEPWEQGFIDQSGVFMSRQEAFRVAQEAGQMVRLCGSEHNGRLYSENLY